MTQLRSAIAAGLISLAFASAASAADCSLHVKRIACSGHEAESYAKCNGNAECEQAVDAAASADACAKAAADACANARPTITKYKSVTATYKGAAQPGGFDADGKPVAGGPNFCGASRPDMNQCQ